MNTPELQKEFVREFIEAEKALKRYERDGQETLVPCINELRYAAYHVAHAIQEGGNNAESVLAHWQKAVRHTRRARYDVLEFSVALNMERVAKISESYKGYEILASSIIPNYFKHQKSIRAISEELETVHELDKESPEYVKLCEKHIRVAKDFIRDFDAAQEVLFSSIAHKEAERAEGARQRKDDRQLSWLQLILSCIISAILGVLATCAVAAF